MPPIYTQCGLRIRSEIEMPLPTVDGDDFDAVALEFDHDFFAELTRAAEHDFFRGGGERGADGCVHGAIVNMIGLWGRELFLG